MLGCSVASRSIHEIVHDNERGGQRSQTSHLPYHNYGELYSASLGSPIVTFPWGGGGEMIQNSHQGCSFYPHKIFPYYSHPSMPPHTWFCVHIALLLLFMYLMEFQNIRLNHTLDNYIIQHTVLFPIKSPQTYFLLIGVLIHQGG